MRTLSSKDAWDGLMSVERNLMRHPPLTTAPLVMQIPAWVWSIIFALAVGSYLAFGISAVAQSLVRAGIFVTFSASRGLGNTPRAPEVLPAKSVACHLRVRPAPPDDPYPAVSDFLAKRTPRKTEQAANVFETGVPQMPHINRRHLRPWPSRCRSCPPATRKRQRLAGRYRVWLSARRRSKWPPATRSRPDATHDICQYHPMMR